MGVSPPTEKAVPLWQVHAIDSSRKWTGLLSRYIVMDPILTSHKWTPLNRHLIEAPRVSTVILEVSLHQKYHTHTDLDTASKLEMVFVI